MGKSVLLDFGPGNVETGFKNITAHVWADDSPGPLNKYQGSLPPNPDLAWSYAKWQQMYAFAWPRDTSRGIKILDNDISNFSSLEFQDICNKIEQLIINWFFHENFFLKIEKPLRQYLSQNDEIQIILDAGEDPLIRRLPLHLWQFFQDFSQAELVISEREWRVVNVSQTPPGVVRILAIFGDSTGLNIGIEKKFLSRLPGADIVFLDEPDQETVIESLTNEPWDILFFAGHSQTRLDGGILKINPIENIKIQDLQYELNIAIENGLQIAIFNSCDGLGIAQTLGQLNIPHVIVMREPILDHLAQAFLKFFLKQLSSGLPLFLAVREARNKLFNITQFPCISWLPVILKNPSSISPTWKSMLNEKRNKLNIERRIRYLSKKLIKLIITRFFYPNLQQKDLMLIPEPVSKLLRDFKEGYEKSSYYNIKMLISDYFYGDIYGRTKEEFLNFLIGVFVVFESIGENPSLSFKVINILSSDVISFSATVDIKAQFSDGRIWDYKRVYIELMAEEEYKCWRITKMESSSRRERKALSS